MWFWNLPEPWFEGAAWLWLIWILNPPNLHRINTIWNSIFHFLTPEKKWKENRSVPDWFCETSFSLVNNTHCVLILIPLVKYSVVDNQQQSSSSSRAMWIQYIYSLTLIKNTSYWAAISKKVNSPKLKTFVKSNVSRSQLIDFTSLSRQTSHIFASQPFWAPLCGLLASSDKDWTAFSFTLGHFYSKGTKEHMSNICLTVVHSTRLHPKKFNAVRFIVTGCGRRREGLEQVAFVKRPLSTQVSAGRWTAADVQCFNEVL